MTLRRIHQNISTLKNQGQKIHLQQITNLQSVLYDEQEPPHPKMFVESPVKWVNSRVKAEINQVGIKTSTARENRRIGVGRNQPGNLTALNISRRSKFQTIGPSNNNSPRQEGELFVPERKKIVEQNKLAMMKTTNKSRNTSFISTRKKSFSPEENQELTQKKLREISQIKLIQPNKTIHHISHLRKYQNEQKQRQTLLNNRLKYITVGNDKDSKKIEMVKRKFEKVVSIRSSSLREKQILSKTKTLIQNQQINHKLSKVGSVKQQQNNRRLSLSRFSHGKTMQASMMREEEKNIEREILSSRLTQLQRKKEAVRNAHSSLEKSRQRISEINRSRISSIRSIENKALVKNYINVEKREKINQKLNQALQRQIKLINQRKLKAATELRQYENFLGLVRDKSRQVSLGQKEKPSNSIEIPSKTVKTKLKIQRAVSSTFSTSGSKSFYLTNY